MEQAIAANEDIIILPPRGQRKTVEEVVALAEAADRMIHRLEQEEEEDQG
ncbi:hypothetical protein [Falsiroseomonas sp. E2-1-a20]